MTRDELDRQRVGDYIRTRWADGRVLLLVVYEVTPAGPLMRPVTLRERLHVLWLSWKAAWRRGWSRGVA